MAQTLHSQPNLLRLEEWCERHHITPENARGYYLPRNRIPGARKVGPDWYVPEESELLPAPLRPRRRKPAC